MKTASSVHSAEDRDITNDKGQLRKNDFFVPQRDVQESEENNAKSGTNMMGPKKNVEIERLRAVAAVMVALYHFFRTVDPPLTDVVRHSWGGVQLFFVISGYVITLSLSRLIPDFGPGTPLGERLKAAGRGLKAFYLRRTLRILPMAYLVALVFFLLVTLLRVDAPVVVQGRVFRVNFYTVTTELISAVTFTYNYVITRHPFQILSPYWSLAVEEHFYLFLPLCFTLLGSDKNRLRFALIGIAVVVFILRPFELFPSWPMDYRRWASHRLFDYLFSGMALALLRKAGVGDRFLARRGPAFTILMNCVSLTLLAALWVEPALDPNVRFSDLTHFALLAISVGLVFLASPSHEYVLGIPGCRRALEYMGSRSYGFYLNHWVVTCLVALFQPKILRIPGVASPLGKFTEIGLIFVVSILMTELLFRMIERPAMEYGLKKTRNSERQAADPSIAAGAVLLPAGSRL
jgi:peptidoglycan/LPS O-acetylase OafA/YrhL